MRAQFRHIAGRLVSLALPGLGFLVVFGALAAPAFGKRAPEIDPGQASSILALLIGSGLLLTHRLRRSV